MRYYGVNVQPTHGLIAAIKVNAVGHSNIQELTQRKIKAKKSSRKIAISAACAANRHYQCFNMLCTCTQCNHPKV